MASVRIAKSRLCIVKNVLSPDQCRDIIEHFSKKKQIPARTQTYGKPQPLNAKVRSGLVVLEDDVNFPHYHNVNELVLQYLMQTGISTAGNPSVQFTVYSTPGDHFKSHADDSVDFHQDHRFFGHKRGQRKVSVTVHLSPPSNYSGCKLQFPVIDANNQWKSYDQDQGTMLIFPSFFNHRVTELHSGTRYSLVLWYHGKLWT